MEMIENDSARILIVDDEPNNLKVLHTLLNENGYHVHALRDSRIVMDATLDIMPDLIMLDINMPYLNGYEVCERLKSHSDTCEIPIIFISARSQQEDVVNGFEVGGLDYITKPIQFHEVLARVRTHVDLYQHKRQLEKQLIELKEMREHEQHHFTKISEMHSQFIQSATHDLKNPLFNIMGYADLLNDTRGNFTPEQISQFSEHIKLSSNKMNILISDMLDLLRVESDYIALDLRMIDFSEFVSNQLLSHQLHAIEKSIDILFKAEIENLPIALDVRLFTRVLDNLISNALKYSPPNTIVRVSVAHAEDGIILDVSDQGYGMSQETIDNLFVPFFRAPDMQKRHIEGTGLGMAVVKEIIERHEGEIHIQSELGKGSTFRVWLPHKHLSELTNKQLAMPSPK